MYEGGFSIWEIDTIRAKHLTGRSRIWCRNDKEGCYPYYFDRCFLAMQSLIDESFFKIKAPGSNLPNIMLQVSNL
jgi:hypothetical protein